MFTQPLSNKTTGSLADSISRKDEDGFNWLITTQQRLPYEWQESLPENNPLVEAALFGVLKNRYKTIVHASDFLLQKPGETSDAIEWGRPIVEIAHMATLPEMQRTGLATIFHDWALRVLPEWMLHLKGNGLVGANTAEFLVQGNFPNAEWHQQYHDIARNCGGRISGAVWDYLSFAEGYITVKAGDRLSTLQIVETQREGNARRTLIHRAFGKQSAIEYLYNHVPVLAGVGQTARFPVEFVTAATGRLYGEVNANWHLLDLRENTPGDLQTQLRLHEQALFAGTMVALLPPQVRYLGAWSFYVADAV
jgi:GNAT superfamily N-acetyltransferase